LRADPLRADVADGSVIGRRAIVTVVVAARVAGRR